MKFSILLCHNDVTFYKEEIMDEFMRFLKFLILVLQLLLWILEVRNF
ncbi:hypothetical protein M900_0368 [Bacteriovorax sp. Seq25_V]|nr:hypothetical protein M900_0368 [Bacteriovorax sp. Seq25_V]